MGINFSSSSFSSSSAKKSLSSSHLKMGSSDFSNILKGNVTTTNGQLLEPEEMDFTEDGKVIETTPEVTNNPEEQSVEIETPIVAEPETAPIKESDKSVLDVLTSPFKVISKKAYDGICEQNPEAKQFFDYLSYVVAVKKAINTCKHDIGLNDEDTQRLMNNEITIEELFLEIESDKDPARRRLMTEVQYLKSIPEAKGYTLDEQQDYINEKLEEFRNLCDIKYGDASVRTRVQISILEGLSIGQDLETVLGQGIYGISWEDEFGYAHIAFSAEDIELAGKNRRVISDYVDLSKYVDQEFLDDLNDVLVEDVDENGNIIHRCDFSNDSFEKVQDKYCALYDEQEEKAAKITEEKIEQLQAKITQQQYIYDTVKEEIDYRFNCIDPYLTLDDFDVYSTFHKYPHYDRLSVLTEYAENYGTIIRPLNLQEKMDLMASIINGYCLFTDDGIMINGKTYQLDDNSDEILKFFKQWSPYISDEERMIFNYKMNKEGLEAAYQYLKDISNELDNRWLGHQIQVDSEYAKEFSALASVESLLRGPVDGMKCAYYSIVTKLNGEQLRRAGIYDKSDIIKSAISQDILNYWAERDHEFTGKLFSGTYNVGMSIGESAMMVAAAPLTGGSSLATLGLTATLMGSRVYHSTLNDCLDRGIDDDTAIFIAFSAAGVESLMEKYSLSHLLNLPDHLDDGVRIAVSNYADGSFKQALAYTLASAGSQGIVGAEEEIATDIVNNLIDDIIAGEKSQYKISKQEYLNNGLTASEVDKKIMKEDVERLIETGVCGFFAESFMGGISGARTANYISEKINHETVTQYKNRLENGGTSQFQTELSKIQTVQRQAEEEEKLSNRVKNLREQLAGIEESIRERVFNKTVEQQSTQDIDNSVPLDEVIENVVEEEQVDRVDNILQFSSENLDQTIYDEVAGSQETETVKTPEIVKYDFSTINKEVEHTEILEDFLANVTDSKSFTDYFSKMIYNVKKSSTIPFGFESLSEYKTAFVQTLSDAGVFEQMDPKAYSLFILDSDTVELATILNGEKIAEALNNSTPKNHANQFEYLKILSPEAFNKLFNNQYGTEYLNKISTKNFANFLTAAAMNKNVNWLNFDAIVDRICNMEIEDFYTLAGSVWSSNSFNEFVREYGDNPNVAKILDTVKNKFVNEQMVFEEYDKVKTLNRFIKTVNYIKVESQALNDYIDYIGGLISKYETVRKETLLKACSGINLIVEENVYGDRFVIKDGIEANAIYELKYRIAGEEFTEAIKTTTDEIDINGWSVHLADKFFKPAMDGTLEIVGLTKNEAKTKLLLDENSGLGKGINEIIVKVDGEEHKIVHVDYGKFGDVKLDLNYQFKNAQDVEIIGINNVGIIELDAQNNNQLYKVGYELDGQQQFVYIISNENGKIDITEYVNKHKLFGATNFTILEEITSEQAQEGVKKISDYEGSEAIFAENRYGGNQSNVANSIKDLFVNNVDSELGRLLNNLIDKFIPNATEIERVDIASHYAVGGCSYVAWANSIVTFFSNMKNGAEIFKQRFGFDIQDSSGTFNIEPLAFDMYLTRFFEGGNAVISEILEKGSGVNQLSIEEVYSKYLAKHGIDMQYTVFDLNTDAPNFNLQMVTDMLNKAAQFNIIFANHFDIELIGNSNVDSLADAALANSKVNGTVRENVGGHAMLITDIDENGDIIVSSWSGKYRYLYNKFNQMKEFYTKIISLNLGLTENFETSLASENVDSQSAVIDENSKLMDRTFTKNDLMENVDYKLSNEQITQIKEDIKSGKKTIADVVEIAQKRFGYSPELTEALKKIAPEIARYFRKNGLNIVDVLCNVPIVQDSKGINTYFGEQLEQLPTGVGAATSSIAVMENGQLTCKDIIRLNFDSDLTNIEGKNLINLIHEMCHAMKTNIEIIDENTVISRCGLIKTKFAYDASTGTILEEQIGNTRAIEEALNSLAENDVLNRVADEYNKIITAYNKIAYWARGLTYNVDIFEAILDSQFTGSDAWITAVGGEEIANKLIEYFSKELEYDEMNPFEGLKIKEKEIEPFRREVVAFLEDFLNKKNKTLTPEMVRANKIAQLERLKSYKNPPADIIDDISRLENELNQNHELDSANASINNTLEDVSKVLESDENVDDNFDTKEDLTEVVRKAYGELIVSDFYNRVQTIGLLEFIQNYESFMPENVHASEYMQVLVEGLVEKGFFDTLSDEDLSYFCNDSYAFNILTEIYPDRIGNIINSYCTTDEEIDLIAEMIGELPDDAYLSLMNTEVMKQHMMNHYSGEQLAKTIGLTARWISCSSVLDTLANMSIEDFYEFALTIDPQSDRINEYLDAFPESSQNYTRLLQIMTKFYNTFVLYEHFENAENLKEAISNILDIDSLDLSKENYYSKMLKSSMENLNNLVEQRVRNAFMPLNPIQVGDRLAFGPVESNSYYDVVYTVDGVQKNATLPISDILSTDPNYMYQSLAEIPMELKSDILKGDFSLLGIVKNEVKSNFVINRDGSLPVGALEITLNSNGDFYTIVVNNTGSVLDLNSHLTNLDLSTTNIVSIVKPGESLIKASDGIYKVLCEDQNGTKMLLTLKAENGYINLDSYRLKYPNRFFGLRNFKIDSKVSKSGIKNILSNLIKLTNFKGFKSIFTKLNYGAYQGEVMYVINNLLINNITSEKALLFNDLMLKYFPNATEMDRINMAEHCAKGGCVYTAVANSIVTYFESIKGGAEIFKNRFGFDLKSGDGTYNTSAIVLDMYLERFYKKGISISEILESRAGISANTFDEVFKEYFAERGVKISKEIYDFDNIEGLMDISPGDSQFSILASEHFDLELLSDEDTELNVDGALDEAIIKERFKEDIGGHAMLITGIAEDGNLIVSSWSREHKFLIDALSKYEDSWAKIFKISFELEGENAKIITTSVVEELGNALNNLFSKKINKLSNTMPGVIANDTVQMSEFANTNFDYTLDSNSTVTDTFALKSKFERTILGEMPENLTQLEKARYIYLKLGQYLNFNTTFQNTSEDNFFKIFGSKVDTETFNKNQVICREWSQLYCSLLTKVGIDARIFDSGHESVYFNVDGTVWIADATADGYTDLARIKNGDTTFNFGKSMSQDMDNQKGIILRNLDDESLFKKMDEKFTFYTTKRQQFENLVKKLEYYKEQNLSIKQKLDLLFKEVGVLGDGYYESKDFIRHLEYYLFTSEEMEKIHAVELKRTNKDLSVDIVQCIYCEGDNGPAYYILAPNKSVIEFNAEEVAKLAVLGYGIEDKTIPGVIYPKNFKRGKISSLGLAYKFFKKGVSELIVSYDAKQSKEFN